MNRRWTMTVAYTRLARCSRRLRAGEEVLGELHVVDAVGPPRRRNRAGVQLPPRLRNETTMKFFARTTRSSRGED